MNAINTMMDDIVAEVITRDDAQFIYFFEDLTVVIQMSCFYAGVKVSGVVFV